MFQPQRCVNCFCTCNNHGPDGCLSCRCKLTKRKSQLFIQAPRSCVQCVHMDLTRLKDDAVVLIRDHTQKDKIRSLTNVLAGTTLAYCSLGYWEGMTHVDEPKKLEHGRPTSSMYIDQATACADFKQRDSRFRLKPLPEEKAKEVYRYEDEQEHVALWGQSEAWDHFIDGIEE